MNANELADKLQELDSKLHLIELFKSANMLRQQEDRIRNLEKTLGFKNSGYETINLTPQLELTDEEILDTFDPHFDADIGDKELIKFARAILRKAQEK